MKNLKIAPHHRKGNSPPLHIFPKLLALLMWVKALSVGIFLSLGHLDFRHAWHRDDTKWYVLISLQTACEIASHLDAIAQSIITFLCGGSHHRVECILPVSDSIFPRLIDLANLLLVAVS